MAADIFGTFIIKQLVPGNVTFIHTMARGLIVLTHSGLDWTGLAQKGI